LSPLLLMTYTLFAMLAFAGNSVLCRLALQDTSIDATSFTIFRLLGGTLMLLILLSSRVETVFKKTNTAQYKQAAYLFLYAGAFSYAYILLGTASGALILFVTVQLTMLCMQYIQGHKATTIELVGLIVALMSFIYWMLPNAHRPDIIGTLLMAIAGVAWGFYTIAGKSSQEPQLDTARNFMLSIVFVPLILPIYLIGLDFKVTMNGLILALASGAITSGLGYWIWYKVLPHYSSLSAGVMQLSVPIIAALGGIIWNQENISLSFILSSTGILFGIFLVLYSNHSSKKMLQP